MSPITDRDIPLTVNGEPRTAPAECSVGGLLALLSLEGRRVAVAVNRDVVPRSAFASRRLAPGDRVEILEAVGGG
ncbi:MAG: sulfur carrier protein ThiS [Myxococcales bacterium]|nr:sulfur carrier protein ThiS [Myxococcales bacterium]MDH5566107.1 sulfur carrier protein ThiS [Myxococcales bacterium]